MWSYLSILGCCFYKEITIRGELPFILSLDMNWFNLVDDLVWKDIDKKSSAQCFVDVIKSLTLAFSPM